LKKNSKSAMKKEQKAKRAKAQRPVQREAKQVLAELYIGADDARRHDPLGTRS